jgi:hypothetical protein
MPLELRSLRKAVSALGAVLAKSHDAEFMRSLDEVARNAIKSGVIQHFEFTVSDARVGISEALHSKELRKLSDLLMAACADRKRIAVIVDNLDSAWGSEAPLDTLAEILLGLLTAASRLSRANPPLPGRVSAAVFLRSDVFYHIRSVAREPDKITPTRIVWADPELLLRVIEQRFVVARGGAVPPEEMWAQYFCGQVQGMATREYLVGRCLPRPRDLVFLVKGAVSVAVNRQHPRVDAADVLEAEKQYSQYALETVLVEGRTELRELEAVLYEFAGAPRVLGRQRLEDLLKKGGIPTSALASVIEKLCDLSFLGLEVGEGDVRFAEDPDEHRRNAVLARGLASSRRGVVRYGIHPAFWTYLELGEPEALDLEAVGDRGRKRNDKRARRARARRERGHR